MTISITNTCEKIEPDELERLFDRFTRLTGNDDIPGSGIGLHYTKTLISRLHGDIHAAWTESDGLTMKLTIPVGKEAFSADEIAETHLADERESVESDISSIESSSKESEGNDTPAELQPITKQRTLLIVEDDPQIHTLLHEILHH